MGKRRNRRQRRQKGNSKKVMQTLNTGAPPLPNKKLVPVHFDFMKGYFSWVQDLIEDHDRWGIEKAEAIAKNWFGFDQILIQFTKAMLAYRHYGQKVYQIPRRFQIAMSRPIGAGRLSHEDLVMPFPCFYMLLPDCPWKIYRRDTGWHQIGGFYVVQEEQQIHFAFWGMANENSTDGGQDAVFWIRLNLNDLFSGGSNLKKYIHKLLAEDEGIQDIDPKVVKEVRKGLASAIYLFFNIVLYMQCRNADIIRKTNVSDQKREGLEEALDKARQSRKPIDPEVKKLKQQINMLSEASIVLIGSVESKNMEEQDKKNAEARSRGEKGEGNKTPAVMPQHVNFYWCGPKTDENGEPVGKCYKPKCGCPAQHRESRIIASYVRNATDDKTKMGTIKRGTRYNLVGVPLTRDQMYDHLGRDEAP